MKTGPPEKKKKKKKLLKAYLQSNICLPHRVFVDFLPTDQPASAGSRFVWAASLSNNLCVRYSRDKKPPSAPFARTARENQKSNQSFPNLCRDPSLKLKRLVLKRRMVEQNGESTPRRALNQGPKLGSLHTSGCSNSLNYEQTLMEHGSVRIRHLSMIVSGSKRQAMAMFGLPNHLR